MKKHRIFALFLSCILLLSLVACSSQNTMSENIVSDMEMYDTIAPSFNGNHSDMKSEGVFVEDTYYEEPVEENISINENVNVQEEYNEKKIVYTANLNMETKDIELALQHIKNSLNEMNGYIESENRNNWNSFEEVYTRRSADLNLRVPSQYFEDFLAGLSNENIIITSMNKDSTDFSEYYYDKESRIDSLRIQESRLLELLSVADNVSVMIEIENSLTDVRYEIEMLTKELKTIDSHVEYSTITIWIIEVARYTTPVEDPETFWDELKEVCADSVEEFVWFLREALFAFIYLLPYIIILIIAIIIIRIIVKKKRAKKAKLQTIQKTNED